MLVRRRGRVQERRDASNTSSIPAMSEHAAMVTGVLNAV